MSASPHGGGAVRWRLPGPERLLWRRLDDGVVVRVSSDGATHWLSDDASAVVLLLAELGPMSLQALSERVLVEHREPDEAPALNALVVQLQELGVLESVA